MHIFHFCPVQPQITVRIFRFDFLYYCNGSISSPWDLEILTLVWILCHLKLSVPCTKLLIIHVETFQWIILQIIYTTRDILYLIYSEGACQYSNSSLQTRLNIEPPIHCKSKYGWDRQEIHIHIFKKLSLLKKIQKRGGSIHTYQVPVVEMW